MTYEIAAYHKALSAEEATICERLYGIICEQLPDAEHKIWHRHPVWFFNGNPVVGYHKLKAGIRVLFWSGQSFDEAKLRPEGSFKASEIIYSEPAQIKITELKRWLKKSRSIQWDYKNIIKRKGKLEKLTKF